MSRHRAEKPGRVLAEVERQVDYRDMGPDYAAEAVEMDFEQLASDADDRDQADREARYFQ